MIAMKMPVRANSRCLESRGVSPRRVEWRQSKAPRSQNAAQNRFLSQPHRVEAARLQRDAEVHKVDVEYV
jgi:hypothetical protein